MFRGKERRRYRRIKTDVNLSVEKYQKTPLLLTQIDGAAKNVSAGGLLIKLGNKFAVDSFILVKFSLPDENDRLEIVAKVVRCEKTTDGYEVGIEFLDSTPWESEKINKYIESRSGRLNAP